MKSFGHILFLLFILLTACKDNKVRNPYLNPPRFRVQVDMNLPQYSPLQYPGNAVYVSDGGILGVFVYNNGHGYNAFEAADPNHHPNDCRAMQLSGSTVRCPCDQNTYSLTDGHLTSGSGQYPMLPYHTSRNGNILYIYN